MTTTAPPGASNRPILDNVKQLGSYNVQVRVPLIPGITDTEENLACYCRKATSPILRKPFGKWLARSRLTDTREKRATQTGWYRKRFQNRRNVRCSI